MPRTASGPELPSESGFQPQSDILTRAWQVVQTELSSYPARWSLAIRMAAACTGVMAVEMVFRVPGAALGAYIPFLLPRDSFQSTWRAAGVTLGACLLSTVAILVGAALFAGSPLTHLFWAIASMFAAFYCISALAACGAAIGLALLIAGSIAIWDAPLSAGARVHLTLYLFLTVVIGCIGTVIVEFLFTRVRHADIVLEGIRVRAQLARRLLRGYVEGRLPSHLLRHRLAQYAGRGTGHLRDVLAASSHDDRYRASVAEALAQSHELVNLCAAAADARWLPSPEDRAHLAALIARLENIGRQLRRSRAPQRIELPAEFRTSRSFPMLSSFERTIDLLADAFSGEETLRAHHPPPRHHGKLFRDGPHLRFAIRGGLSAMLCYIAYMAAGWRGLNASVITCFLTALTSVGVSRQRQLLRLLGVFIGGCILGIGSQSLLLPRIETLPEFALVFGACIFLCAWVATSGPRLAFAGVQMSLAYVLVTLNGFGITTSLIPVRDTLLGIVLGLGAMWLVYDHLWAVPSAAAHRDLLLQLLRRLIALAVDGSPEEIRREREWSARAMEDLRTFADARVFEPHRQSLQEHQPLIGSLALTLYSLLEHAAHRGERLPLTGEVLHQTTHTLEALAARIERNAAREDAPDSLADLIHRIESAQLHPHSPASARELRLAHSLAVLLREI